MLWVCHAHDWTVVFLLCFDWRDFLFDLPMYRSTLAWTSWAILRLKGSIFYSHSDICYPTGLCASSPSSGSGKGGFWSGWWVSQAGTGEAQPWAPGAQFFSAWSDTELLYRAQLLLAASSCREKCLQSCWLLKHPSRGMCNFHHFPPWERWDFSLRGMDACCTDSGDWICASKWNFTAWPSSSELTQLLVSFGRRYATKKVTPEGTEYFLG